MSSFSVTIGDGGHIALAGAMTFDNAEAILRKTQATVSKQPTVVIDLTEVSHTDSASLALLLEWIAVARQSGGDIQFKSVPDRVLAIAQTGEISDLVNRYSSASPSS